VARSLIHAGEGVSGYTRLAREQSDFRARLERLLAEPVEATTATRATSGGDRRRLRGLPCIGPGVQGAIAGSVPHWDGLG
jgi:hypothetical protein